MKESKKHKKGCGCSDSPGEERRPALDTPTAETTLLGKKFVRRVETPPVAPRTRMFKQPEDLSEIVLQSPGTIPLRVAVPASEVNLELVKELQKTQRDIPAPPVKKGSAEDRFEKSKQQEEG